MPASTSDHGVPRFLDVWPTREVIHDVWELSASCTSICSSRSSCHMAQQRRVFVFHVGTIHAHFYARVLSCVRCNNGQGFYASKRCSRSFSSGGQPFFRCCRRSSSVM